MKSYTIIFLFTALFLLLMNAKKKNEKYEKLCSKIRYLTRSVTKNSDYDEKYMKIKFNSEDELPLNKTIKILSMIVVVRAIFLENS